MHETNAPLTANLPSLPGVTWEALDRYFAGEATPAEASVVQAALQAHPEVAGIVQHFAGAVRGPVAKVDAKAMLSSRRTGSINDLVATPTRPEGTRHAPAARGWRPSVSPHRYIGIPLALAATLTIGFFTIKHIPNLTTTSTTAPTTKTYTTQPGQRANITLADGTGITLAPATTIHVTGAAGRNIDLDGEAVFTVNQQSTTSTTAPTTKTYTTQPGQRANITLANFTANNPLPLSTSTLLYRGAYDHAASIGRNHANGEILENAAEDVYGGLVGGVDAYDSLQGNYGAAVNQIKLCGGSYLLERTLQLDIVERDCNRRCWQARVGYCSPLSPCAYNGLCKEGDR